MAETPSFEYLAALLVGVTMLVSWVISDALEEQLIGRARRVRQKAAKAIETAGPLPRARVHQRS